MKRSIRCRLKPYIQPFERILAIKELSALSNTEPRPLSMTAPAAFDFEVVTSTNLHLLSERLAYWEVLHATKSEYTAQALREATASIVKNGVSFAAIREHIPFSTNVPLPNRRCLRYGTHGIHEYRGKFFPQLVRALLNMSGIPRKGVVADPMCGSGTTVVEGLLTGLTALGLDMNPLSVFMTRTKCQVLSLEAVEIEIAYHRIRDSLLKMSTEPSSFSLAYFRQLPDVDRHYLTSWFSEQVLIDLDKIAAEISKEGDDRIKDLYMLVLSNIIRRVSWQKVDDLRVRKEIKDDADIDPIKEFLEELGRSVRVLVSFLRQNGAVSTGDCRVQRGDARRIAEKWDEFRGQVDCIVTSPPYANALPYLDTDRLSLCYLGLLTRSSHRKTDELMIGNREINQRMRVDYLAKFLAQKKCMPASVSRLVERIEKLNRTHKVGFRRTNMPALLAKYFLDMREVLIGMHGILRSGCSAYVVVGNNHTIAGGQKVVIDTGLLLGEISEQVGFELEDSIGMEMLTSRDIFRKNAIESERIVCLRKQI